MPELLEKTKVFLEERGAGRGRRQRIYGIL
jgi:hypothetical protein